MANDLPEGFDLDAPPDGFEVDTEPAKPSMPAEVVAGRQAMPLMERGRAAARKMQQVGLAGLDPDELQALKAALKQYDASQQVGTGEAMLGLGLNTAGGEFGDEAAGLYGALRGGPGAGDDATADARDFLRRAKDQHPVAGTLAQIGGGLAGSLASPGGAIGKLANIAQGAITGAGAGEDWRSRVQGGIGGGVLAAGANAVAPHVVGALANAGGAVARGAGKVFQAPHKLMSWLTGAADNATAPPGVASVADQMAEAAAANPGASEAVTKTQIMPMAAGAEGQPPVPLEKETGAFRAPIDRSPAAVAEDAAANGRTNVTPMADWAEQWERMHPGERYHQYQDPQVLAETMQEVNQQGLQKVPDKSMLGYGPDDVAALEKLRSTEPWNAPDDGSLLRDRTPRATDADKPWWWQRHYGRGGTEEERWGAIGDHETGMDRARDRQGWDDDSRVTDIMPDPRRGERGFGSIDLLATMAGIKPASAMAKGGIKLADRAGKAMSEAGEQWRPSAIAAKLASDESSLAQLAQQGGKLGRVGQMLLQTRQKSGPDAAKAQAYVIAQQPWFREQYQQGTGGPMWADQDPMSPTGSY